MIKYIPELTDVVLEEVPDRVTLAVEIPNCQGSCPGCHSSFLKLDLGKELTAAEADRLVEDNFGVNCFLFLGEGNDHEALMKLAAHLRAAHPDHYGLRPFDRVMPMRRAAAFFCASRNSGGG